MKAVIAPVVVQSASTKPTTVIGIVWPGLPWRRSIAPPRNWSAAPGPMLASFDATPSTTPVANLRAQVCAPGGVPEDPDVLLTSVGATAALGPPTKVMAPVPVYTGHADVAEGDIKAAAPAAPRNVPLPRLRPTAGLATPRVYAAEPTPATVASDQPLDLTQMH